MLDDDERISKVAQALKRTQQLVVIALVQADARLVEDIQHSHQAGADLRGKSDALALAAGQRRRRAGQRQISKPDVHEEAETGLYLFQNTLGDHHVLLAELERIYEFQRADNGQIGELRDVHAADRHRERGLFQPASAAVRARSFGHALLKLRTHSGTLRLLVAPLEVIRYALELAPDHAKALVFLISELKRLALCAVHQRVYRLGRYVLDGIGQLEVIAARERVIVHPRYRVALCIAPAARGYAAVHDAEVRVRHYEIRIDEQTHAEAGAGRTGAVGVIEREQARGKLVDGDAAVLTGVILREAEPPVLLGDIYRKQSARERHRRLRGVRQAADDVRLYD